ncbi:hypothetical protein [Streptomyces sp. NBC_00015]|uniref:nucleotide-binding domain-containing protein n=1 Tax=Streptomyces sp. NBC_00015 TaxID=2903611 RepID=UPI00386C1235
MHGRPPPIGSVTLATSSLSGPLPGSVAPPEAERRDKIRGQIIDSSKRGVRIEHSDFKGEHVVECYVVKDGVVVARDRDRRAGQQHERKDGERLVGNGSSERDGARRICRGLVASGASARRVET